MLYLLDANAVRDLMNEHPAMGARVARVTSADQLSVCSIVRGEVLFGIERMAAGKRREAIAQKANVVLDSVEQVAVPVAAGDHYARVKRSRERLGLPMDENDLWIAATAMALDATLITRDGDFAAVPQLRVEDWTR
jgi:predicted nucleic acid-binding protein